MRVRVELATSVVLFAWALGIGCSAAELPDPYDTTWVGTITTEGNVTTVVNESGSVWGGTARLVRSDRASDN